MFTRLGSVFILGCLFGGLCGCYSYTPIVVEVRDAEVDRPISGAYLETVYLTCVGDVSPKKSNAITNAQGQATLTVTDPGRASLVAAAAGGYIDGWAGFSTQKFVSWRARSRTRPATTAASSKPSSDFIIRLYSKPDFSVVLVVPNGYRGVIGIRKRYGQAPFSVGQREFAVKIDPKTVNEVWLPLQLVELRVPEPHWRARYGDGTGVPDEGSEGAVRLRWVTQVSGSFGGTVYIIGTNQEREAAFAKYFPIRGDEEFERAISGK